jgi:hypothetical protein
MVTLEGLRRGRFSTMKRLALVLVVLLTLTLAPSASAKPSWTNTRMAGLWITTDCVTDATDGTHYYDCGLPGGPLSGIPGDASAMSLDIAAGAVPMVRFVDTYSTYCANNGKPYRFIATGYGTFTVPPETEARTMIVTFTKSWCGTEPNDFAPGEAGLHLNQADDPSFDSLWDDNPDQTDWGYLWERAN